MQRRGEEDDGPFRLLVDHMQQGAVTLDGDGGIVYCNVRFAEMRGEPRARLVGRRLADLVPPVQRPTLELLLSNYRTHTCEGETLLQRADGTTLPVLLALHDLPQTTALAAGVATGLLVTDLTRRRQRENVDATLELLRTTLASIGDAVITTDNAGHVVFVNDIARLLTGWSQQEAAGRPLEQVFHLLKEQTREPVPDPASRALGEKGAVGFTERKVLIDRMGTEYPIDVNAAPIRDERGIVGGAVFVFRDVTERRRAEGMLRDSEERRSLALDAAELGTWNIDPATNTLTTDLRFREIFTGTHDAIAYEEAFAVIHPDDVRLVRDRVAAATDPANPVPYAAEYRVVHGDGSVHWVFGKGRSRFEETPTGRRLVSFDGTVGDITDRIRFQSALTESEARFRQLADTIPQLAWTAGPDGHIDWYNSRWLDYTGRTFEEMQGWGWQSVHDPDVLPLVLARWNESLADGKPFDMVFPLRGKDGVFRPFLTKIVPFHDDEGRIVRWFGSNTDVSEQQTMQDELRRTAAELSEAGRRKDEFLATLAHELRNPLSPIKSAVQLLQRLDPGTNVEQFREYTDVVDRQVDQMVRLIDDLLDVARISRGTISLQCEPCDLRAVVASAVEATTPIVEKAGHEFLVENTGEPLPVLGDAARLAQVLANLLTNAARYTPEGGEVHLSAERHGDEAVLRVRDTGMGIAPDDLARVFEMFQQLDAGGQHGQSGLGIGLSLVRNLVELHLGHVEVESDGPGRGSEFRVRLPLWSGDVPPADESEASHATPTAGRRFRVLVVEDMRANRHMLVRLLRTMGHEVEEAEDGEQGLEKVLSFDPEVILSDISMPNMNGHEMARRLREIGRDVPMIALTGYGRDTDREHARAAGFDDHVVKPADISVLTRLFADLANGTAR